MMHVDIKNSDKGVRGEKQGAKTQEGQFIAALLSHIKPGGHGHITYSYSDGSGLKADSWEINEKMQSYFFILHCGRRHTEIGFDSFLDHFSNILSKSATIGIIFRALNKNSRTGDTYAEIRGYAVSLADGQLKYQQLSAEEVRSACNTDAETGNPIDAEHNVVYGGSGDDKIYN